MIFPKQQTILPNLSITGVLPAIRAKAAYWTFAISGWLVILVSLCLRRSHQDSWVLEGIFPFVLLFCAAFIWTVIREEQSGRLTVVASIFVTVLRLIPGLKYKWAYGTAVDQMVHVSSIQNMMQTGFPAPDTPYTNIPGMHALLSVIGQISGTTVDDVVGYGFPLILGLVPFMIYFLLSQIRINSTLRNQIVIVSAFAFDPYFLLIQGAPFGVFLILLVLVFFLSREFSTIYTQLPLTIGLLGSIIALTFGHGVSSIIFILIVTCMPFALKLAARFIHLPMRNTIVPSVGRLFVFVIVLFSSWWMYQARGVFYIFVNQIWSFVSRSEVEKAPIPSRVSELGIFDLIVIFWSLHGNVLIIAVLAGIGVVIFWRRRDSLSPRFRTVLVTLFLIEVGIGILLVGQILTGFGNLEYFRLLGYAIVLSPIFGGATLWMLHQKSRWVWGTVLTLIIFVSLFQIFPHQPSVPGGDSLFATIDSDDYILYLHSVVTDYQASMLGFVQTNVAPTEKIMSDRVTKDEAYRFFGPDLAKAYGIQYQYDASADLDEGIWELLLLHRAGTAGPFSEQVEKRHDGQIDLILSSADYAVVYNNGESFILMKR